MPLLQHSEKLQHFLELRIPHVLLADEDADGGPARKAPVAAHKVKLRLNVIDEKGHVM